MDLTSRNTKQLFVVRTVKTSGYVRTYTDLNDGQVAITDPKGNSVAAGDGTPGGLFRIVARVGTNLYWSPLLSGSRSTVYPYVAKAKGKERVIPVQQVSYIGYNGTSGSITVTNSNVYKIWIHMKELSAVGQGENKIKYGVYQSTSSDTQLNIAYELHQSLINNFSREPWKDIRFERVYSGAAATALGNITLTNGSKYFVSAIDDTANITTGSIVRFGGTGAGTTPCYVVVGNDGGAAAARVYELDTPYQGASVAAEANAETCAVGGNWGIKCTGVARTPYFDLGKTPYSIPMFELYLDDFGSTAVTYTTAAVWGVGTGYQVAEDELFSQGFEKGNFTDQKDWLLSNRQAAVLTDYYDYITLMVKDEKGVSSIIGNPSSPSEICIACYNAGAHAIFDAVEDILDEILGDHIGLE